MAPRTGMGQRTQRDSTRRTIFDDETEGRSYFAALSRLGSTKLLLGATVAMAIATFADPSSLLGVAKSQLPQLVDDGRVGDALPHVTKDGKYHGRYPNSLLTLFYPFTLLRDVVLDQPLNRTDVPFFWHVHVSDEIAVKKTLTKCYGAELIELDTIEDIEKAKKLSLVKTLSAENRLGKRTSDITKQPYYNQQISRPVVITSPHIRETSELFDQDNSGRMFSFYRHPIDYDVHPQLKQKLPPEAGANNFLTRLLSDVHVGDLGFKELGIAKQVIRQVGVTGTRDSMAESLFRIGKYMGWVPVYGMGTQESEESDDEIVKACIEEFVQSSPDERYADHNSPEWQVFYKRNMLDCQLYEIARSTWRAQIQTIIPLTLQMERKCIIQAGKEARKRDPVFVPLCQDYFEDEEEEQEGGGDV
ncbi:hypothetical protein ACHAXN_000986 [Cyclotella atomus]